MINVKSHWYQSTFAKHIGEIVEAVKLHYGVFDSPVKLQNLIDCMGIRIRYAPISHDGMVHRESNHYVITINPKHHKKRNRFTTAHEIGHIILDDHLIPQNYFNQSDSIKALENKWEVERFADLFASHLLVPYHSIENLSDWSKFSIHRIMEGARKQGVSVSVFLGRLLEKLGGGYIWLNHMNKPTDSSEFRWRLFSGRFPKLDIERQKYYLPKFDSIDFESPILSALDNKNGVLLNDIDLDFGSLKGKHTVFAKAMTSSLRLSKGKTVVRGDTTILLLVFPKYIDLSIISNFADEFSGTNEKWKNTSMKFEGLFA